MSKETAHLVSEAKYLFRLQKHRKAEKIFKKILEKKNSFADVHNCLGLIALEDGRFGDATKSFNEALKINPHYTEAMLNLSILFNDMGQYDQAKKLVGRSKKSAATGKSTMDPFVRSKLANKHADVGDWYHGVGVTKDAIVEYKKALELEPSYADIRTKMAVCLREQGDYKTAIEELKNTIKLNHRYIEAYVQLGITQFTAEKKTEARQTWKSAAQKFPSNKTLKMYLRFTEKK